MNFIEKNISSVSKCSQTRKTKSSYSTFSNKSDTVSPRLNVKTHKNEFLSYCTNSFGNTKLLNGTKRNYISSNQLLKSPSINQFKIIDRKLNQSKGGPKKVSHLISNKEREQIADSCMSRKNEINNNYESKSNRIAFDTNIYQTHCIHESHPISMYDADRYESKNRNTDLFDIDKSGATCIPLSDSLNQCNSWYNSHRSIINDESNKYTNVQSELFNHRDRNHLNDRDRAHINDSSLQRNNSQYKTRIENIDNNYNPYQFHINERSNIGRSSSCHRSKSDLGYKLTNAAGDIYTPKKDKFGGSIRHSAWGIKGTENKELENKITSLYSKINQFERQSKDLIDQRTLLNARTKELYEKISINNSLNNEISTLKLQMKDMERERKHLNEEFKESIERNKSLQIEIIEMKYNELRLSESTNNKLKNEIKAKETELNKQTAENSLLRNEMKKMENRIKDLQINEAKSLWEREVLKEKEVLNSNNREFEIEIGCLKEKLRELLNENKSLFKELNELKRESDQLKRIEKENKDLKDQIKCLSSRTKELNEQISINNSLNNEMNKLKFQIKDMERERKHLNEELKESIERNKSLQIEMNEIKDTQRKLSESKDKELKKALKSKEMELDKQIRENEKLHNEVRKIENQIEDWKTNEVKSLREREVLKENEILNSKNKETEIKIGSLNEKLEELLNKNKSLYTKLSELKRENDELKLKQSTLDSKTNKLNAVIDENNLMRDEINDLKKQKEESKFNSGGMQEYQNVLKENQLLSLKVQEYEREVIKSNNYVALKNEELEKQMNYKKTLNIEIKELQDKIENLEILLDKKSSREREVMKENEILNSKNKETEIKIGNLNETVKELINKNKSLNAESSDIKRQNDELKLKQSTLDSKTNTLNVIIDENSSMKNEIYHLKKQIDEESKLYSGRKIEYQNLMKENQSLSSKVQEYEREIIALKMNLTMKTEELEKEINQNSSIKGKINEQDKHINTDNKLISELKVLAKLKESNKLLSQRIKILELQIDCFKCSDKELKHLKNKELEKLIEEETVLTKRILEFDKKIDEKELLITVKEIIEEARQSEKKLIVRLEDLESEYYRFYNNVPPVTNDKQLVKNDNESEDGQKDRKSLVVRSQSERRTKRNTHSDPNRRSTWGAEKMPHGFNNPKGYCFLNSVVQLLYSCSEFVEHFKKSIRTNSVTNEKEIFFYNFSKLIDAMDKNNYENVNEYVSKIQDFFIESSTGDDVHACYMKILSILLEVTKASIQSEKSVAQNNSDSKVCFENFRQQNNGFIFDLFYGQMSQQVICTKCNHVFTSSHQLFKSIPLPVPKNDDEFILTDLINMFLEKSPVEADQIWQGKCSGNCENVYSCTMFTHVPKYLFIYLNRGSYFNDGVKKNTFIYSGMELKISVGSIKERYHLISTIDHIGNSEGGHYYARSCYGTDQWWLVNDSQVRQINFDNEIVTKNTIVFLFKKCEDSKYSEIK